MRHLLCATAALAATCSLSLPSGAQSSSLQVARVSYTYDDTGRLTRAVYADPSTGDRAIVYRYSGTGAIAKRLAGPADAVDTEGVDFIPDKFRLTQNYPNPFWRSTNIRYDVPRAADVRIEVFDLIGRRVAVLVDDLVQPGAHVLSWNNGPNGMASGVYFCRMTSPDGSFTTTMVVAR